jgi:hypothetical protein
MNPIPPAQTATAPPQPVTGREDTSLELLRVTLQAGVPLQITTWQHQHRSVEWLTQRANQVAQVMAEHGDKLMYRTPRRRLEGGWRPGTAQVCAALIEAVAAAALVAPGGITVLGLRFDADLPEPISDIPEDEPACSVCGCTEDDPCPGGCHWVPSLDPALGDLCSACVGVGD